MKGPATPAKTAPSIDTSKLKEEVRVLQEALDVMQKQAEEYEKEIRSLKDKSRPSRGVRTAGGKLTPRKQSSSMDLEATLSQLGQAAAGGSSKSSSGASSSRDVLLESISLETALFRPALSSAVQSANYWKTKAMGSALEKLTPLNVPKSRQSLPLQSLAVGSEAEEVLDEILPSWGGNNKAKEQSQCMEELALARNEVRLAKASFSIFGTSSRSQLSKEQHMKQMAELRLQQATSSWLKSTGRDSVATPLPSSLHLNTDNRPLGRITLPCRDGMGFSAPLTVNNAELRNLHSFLLQ